ncbi:hypothetical protein QJS83_10620 [Bdellovibrio sp. 22V]|uniref:hypothetical protein n=1 Tax=Bdellovibrio TaxID=958 RepID=UPI00254362C6|nr:hypothetical protein [Bdellovibrio sp. 22V]WII70914.1 hypothetical protein QJS83_10620 [Bdellovibrio sp. 22V]
MRSVLSLSFSMLMLSSASWAALATDAGTAVSFFRNKNSLFPSGQVSRTKLEDKLIRSETEIAYRTSWDKKEYVLNGDQILRDIQVSRFVETKNSVVLLSLDRAEAPPVKTLPAKASLEILSTDDYWARVQEKSTGAQGYLPLHLLQSRHDDAGVFVNLVDTYIRKEASAAGKVITTLPRLRRVTPLEISKSFLKIKYNGHIGFVDTTHFVSRADFANLAYHPKKNWVAVLYRNNDAVITQQGLTLPMKELLGFVTNSHRGIIVRPDSSYGPPLRARVEILKPEAHIWGVSTVDGHGEVWWKKKDLLIEEAKPSTTTISTDTLMKREIYSIAFENKNSVRGLISSEGVYTTEDGITWTMIPFFGKQNYPVSIHPNGTWFVGSYKSTNKGKSFEPFIRWDNIAQAIESAYHRNPKIMRLTQIEALPNSRIQIHVDTGAKQVKLRSLIGDLHWDVIKN